MFSYLIGHCVLDKCEVDTAYACVQHFLVISSLRVAADALTLCEERAPFVHGHFVPVTGSFLQQKRL